MTDLHDAGAVEETALEGEVVESGSTAVATLPKALTPAVVFRHGGVEDIVSRIEREARAVPRDISTESGRKAVKSLAYRIAKSKVALDDMGKTLTETARQQINTVNAERNIIAARLDALKKEVRKELDEFEAAAKHRAEENAAAIATMIELASASDADTAVGVIDARIERLGELYRRPWEIEFRLKAERTWEDAHSKLAKQRARAVEREAERIELERLRAAQAARELEEAAKAQAAREEAIRQEAAEKARKAAEEKAAADAKAEAGRVEAERLAAEQAAAEQAAAAKRALEKAEAERVEAEAQVERLRIQAERDRITAEANARRAQEEAEAARIATEARIARERAEAVEAERKVAEERDAKEKAERDRRLADHMHKRTINRAVIKGLIEIEGIALSEEQATAIMVALAMDKVPHTKISY